MTLMPHSGVSMLLSLPIPHFLSNYEPQDLLGLRTQFPGVATTLVQLFRMHAPDVVTMLYVAVYYEDWTLLHRTLSRLRGSSAAVGGNYVAHLCGAVETLLDGKQTDMIPLLIPRIEEAVDELLAALPQ